MSRMKPTTAETLAQLIRGIDLVPSADLDEVVRAAGGSDASAEEVGGLLVRKELLTGYQLERLLKGEPGGYFYGRAKILYQIGAGSFARVFRAIHRDTGAILAVKVLRSRHSSDAAKRRAFQHEGEMGRLLRHPNIVAVEDVGQHEDTSYITLEFIEGQTLRELVRIRGAIDLPRALDLIHQMLSGLEYAHRRGVTHRDLKASNVIVSATGQAKLVDFGLADVDESGDRSLGRMEQPRTVDYAALEKLSGMRDDSVRSDIYFLGTIAYLALSGVSPLTESRDRNVRADPRRFTDVVPLGARAPQLPRDVVEFVARMMHLDPLERWQTAAEARRATEQLITRHAATERADAGDSAVVPATDQAASVAAKGNLMLVESGQKSQEKLRQYLTKLGFRVLLTESPQRALVRCSATPPAADCLVISAVGLGAAAAVEVFNQLSTDPAYANVPAILLAGPQQAGIEKHARTDRLRKVVQLPVPSKQLGRLLVTLIQRKT
jgi:CheY-like chemotaxis protein